MENYELAKRDNPKQKTLKDNIEKLCSLLELSEDVLFKAKETNNIITNVDFVNPPPAAQKEKIESVINISYPEKIDKLLFLLGNNINLINQHLVKIRNLIE